MNNEHSDDDALVDAARARLDRDAGTWDTDAAWQRLSHDAVDRRVRSIAGSPGWRRRRPWIAALAAATIALAAIGVWRATTARVDAPVAAMTIEAPNGAARELTLPDSTRVVLDAGSRLRYDADYGVAGRDVRLEGAAYFVVTHDAARPFRVHASGGVAEDLGTRFVVRAYDAGAPFEVAVAEGRVAMRADASAAGAELAAGQVGRIGDDRAVHVTSGVDVDGRLGWTRGELAYDDVPLADVIPQLARWYDVDIRVADARLGARRLTARFVAGQPASAVVEALALALGARAERDGRVVTLHAGATP